MNEARAILQVRSIFFGNPGALPPLLNAALCLRMRGHGVSLLGLNVTKQLALPSGLLECPQVLLGAGRSLAARMLNALRFAHASAKATDWRVVNDPITCLLTLGASPSIVYHEHDPPDMGWQPLSWLIRLARRRVLAAAKVLIFPSEERLQLAVQVLPEAQRNALRARSVVVWNCPMRADIIERTRFPGPNTALKLYFHGSITGQRLPLWVLDALAQARHFHTLTVVGYETAGSVGHVAALQARALELGIGGRLRILGPVSRETLNELATGHDLGLCLYDRSGGNAAHNSMLGPSNKVFDYLSVGIVPLLDSHPEWQPLLDAPMALMLAESNANGLVSLLDRLAETPATLQTCVRIGQQRLLRDWHFEAQFAPVIAALEA